jgi:hypothetical protein
MFVAAFGRFAQQAHARLAQHDFPHHPLTLNPLD